jgi:hypothetical protein
VTGLVTGLVMGQYITYKEETELLRQTLDVLPSHLQTRDRYHICLAMEVREIGCEKKALQLIMEYTEVFAEIDYSMHPVIGGEAPGKSSNVNSAARHMAAKFDAKEYTRQIITVIDSDTCLAQSYFQLAAELCRLASDPKSCFVSPSCSRSKCPEGSYLCSTDRYSLVSSRSDQPLAIARDQDSDFDIRDLHETCL